MEIRVYKTGEDKKIDIRGTSFDHIKTVDKFKDIVFKYTSGETISIFVEGEKVVSSEYDNYKDFSGNDLGSNISDTINGLRTILLSNSEVDSYVIGDDLSQKSTETIFTHQTAGAARGLGGRLIVDDNNSKLNVTRSANQGTSGLEVRVTGASGSDIGSIVGTGAYSNSTRDFFTATAGSGQLIQSSFTVHGRFIAEDGIYLGTGGGSALALTDLAEVPSSLGTSGQVLAVNSGGTALEFVAQSGGSGGSSTLLGLTDTPSGFGSTGQVLVVNAGRNALEFATPLQLGTSSSKALAGDTTTITTSQALAINANSSKASFPGFGTASGTALEGDTALFDGAYSSLSGIPSSFTPASHSHAQSEITGLVSALAAKANTGDLSDVALSNDYDDLSNTPTTITSSQASAITANTAKTGITSSQASAITANTAKVGITTQQASDITANNAKVSYTDASAVSANTAKVTFPGFGTTGGTALEGDTTLLELGTTSSTALAGDTTTITSGQAAAITANTAKTGITSGQASAITANTAKTGITSGQASAITANTAKTGITSGQASAITANTAKTGITSGQASAITANTAKTSFPGFGTTSGTALEGDTSLFSGAYADLTGKPSLFDGSYTSLTSVPSTFAPSSHNHSISEITSLQTTLDGLIPYSGASSNVNLNSKALTGVSSITSSAALFGASPANLRAFNLRGTGLNGRISLQGGSGDNPGLELTTDSNASRVLLRLQEVGTDGTSLELFSEEDGGNITLNQTFDGDGSIYWHDTSAKDAGIRNNSGAMQFKNSSGSWTDIPSSGGGSTNELDGQSVEYITRSSAYANNTWEGEVVKFGSDTLVQNKFYVHTSSGWVATDADTEAKTKGLFGIALGTSSATNGILVKGIHSSSAHSFSAGDTLYVGTTEGSVTTTAPSTTGDFLRVVGYVLANGYIYINPSPDYIEIA